MTGIQINSRILEDHKEVITKMMRKTRMIKEKEKE